MRYTYSMEYYSAIKKNSFESVLMGRMCLLFSMLSRFVRTDAEAEAPVLWPHDVKSLLTGKDPDARKD